MSKSFSTFVACLGFIIGTICAPNFSQPPNFLLFLVTIIGLISWLVHNKLFYFYLCLFSLILGINHFYSYLQPLTKNNINQLANQTTTITGTITEPPIIKNNHQQIIINHLFSNKQQFTGQAIIITNPFPVYSFGQQLAIEGKINQPQSNENSSFSYPGYLALNQIFVQAYYPKITITQSANPSFLSSIFQFKKNIIAILKKYLNPINSAFVAGIILGEKNALPTNVYEQFRQLGLTHIIVVSGFNLTIFANFFTKNLRGHLNRRLGLILTIIILVIFTILTGSDSSIVRALIMSIITLLAPHLGRRNSPYLALLLAATIMIYLNPLVLWYDLGFHLSFLATIGLVFFSPLFTKITKIFAKPGSQAHPLINTFIESLAAQITTTPYIIYLFGNYSLLSLPANFLIVPLIPYLMFLGLFCLLISPLLPHFILSIIFFPLDLACTLVIKIIELLSRLTYFNHQLSLPKNLFIIYYCLIFLYVFSQYYQSQRTRPASQ